ncbi:hypothetical protein ACHAWF_005280 [Thalassiosira exigua]
MWYTVLIVLMKAFANLIFLSWCCFFAAHIMSIFGIVAIRWLGKIPPQKMGEIIMWMYVFGCSVFVLRTYQRSKAEYTTMERLKHVLLKLWKKEEIDERLQGSGKTKRTSIISQSITMLQTVKIPMHKRRSCDDSDRSGKASLVSIPEDGEDDDVQSEAHLRAALDESDIMLDEEMGNEFPPQSPDGARTNRPRASLSRMKGSSRLNGLSRGGWGRRSSSIASSALVKFGSMISEESEGVTPEIAPEGVIGMSRGRRRSSSISSTSSVDSGNVIGEESECKRNVMASVTKSRTDGKYDEWSPEDLRAILQQSAVFAPSELLSKLFKEIDDDGSGTINGREMRAHLEKSQGETRWTRRRKTIRQCFLDWEFYANWIWIVASILHVIAIYLGREGLVTIHTLNLLRGLGNIGWLLGGIFCLPPALRSIYTLNDYCYELSHAMDRLTSLLSGTNGAKELDLLQLYDSLLKNGLVLPFEVCRTLFKKADTSHDGLLQMAEISDYINKFKTKPTWWRRHLQVFIQFFTSAESVETIFLILQGVMWTCSSYASKDIRTSLNFGLAGMVMLLYGSSRGTARSFLGFWREMQHVQRGKATIKHSLIEKAT